MRLAHRRVAHGKMSLVMTLLILVALVARVAQGGPAFHTTDPLKAFVDGAYDWGDDYFIHGNQDTTLFRCVLVKEKQGFDGLALSEVSIWGNHGGPWEIFRKVGKGFDYVGSQELHDTSCLESCSSKDYLASGHCDWHRGWPIGTGSRRSPDVVIDTLSAADLSSAPFECDCEFYRGRVDGNSVVFATREHRTRGLAKIGGRTVSLHLVTKPAEADCHDGRRFSERWEDGSVSIGVEASVTGSGAESCWYRGRIIVREGGHADTILVTGSCGC
jgi:hypothetical protein